jgi:hypothetical protein
MAVASELLLLRPKNRITADLFLRYLLHQFASAYLCCSAAHSSQSVLMASTFKPRNPATLQISEVDRVAGALVRLFQCALPQLRSATSSSRKAEGRVQQLLQSFLYSAS